jgi:hypothetical protein
MGFLQALFACDVLGLTRQFSNYILYIAPIAGSKVWVSILIAG